MNLNLSDLIGPRERSERGLTKPLLPPTGAPKSATENHHFWEASKASPEMWLPLSRAKREKFPTLHTPYWCTQKCHRKPPLYAVLRDILNINIPVKSSMGVWMTDFKWLCHLLPKDPANFLLIGVHTTGWPVQLLLSVSGLKEPVHSHSWLSSLDLSLPYPEQILWHFCSLDN